MTRRDIGATVLLEGHNLTLPTGTGIATYARHLADAVRDLGYRTEVLVGSNRRIDTKDQQLAEIVLLDAPSNSSVLHKAGVLLGAPLGVRPATLEGLRGTVKSATRGLESFERIHAVPHLMDLERIHFMRHRRRMRVHVEPAPKIFHATRQAPLEVKGAANLYTVHDVVPLRLPDMTADDKTYHLAMLRELVRTADHIVTVSEFSRQDIIALTGIEPRRITNAYQTVAFPEPLLARTTEDVQRSLRQRHDLEFKEYYLFVGAIEPKKNLARLLDAYGASGVRRPLVLAGGLGWMYEPVLDRISSERYLSFVATKDGDLVPRRRVRRLSYLPLQDIVDLIRGARALLYPSIYEGFGLPPAEAMLLGTPVMTSAITSLPEIAGGAALLVDPYDVEAMAEAIKTLDRDEDLLLDLADRGKRRAAEFSREKHAERIDRIYRDLS